MAVYKGMQSGAANMLHIWSCARKWGTQRNRGKEAAFTSTCNWRRACPNRRRPCPRSPPGSSGGGRKQVAKQTKAM
eukprot:9111111-Pyramimonas_sp.AAC.1